MYGNRLRELRLEHGFTMEEVGKKIGVKKSSYASYETKYRQPPLEKLKSFSKLYGVSVDYILGLTNEKDETTQVRRLREICVRKGLQWEGIEIPNEVLVLLERALDEANQNNIDLNQYRKES